MEQFPELRGDGAIIDDAAKQLYPQPKITVPRVVSVRGWEYRISEGHVEYRAGNCAPAPNWSASFGAVPASMIPLLTDLYANPTEEVEDDDA